MQTSYRDIIRSEIDTVYHTGIANKILKYMDDVRNMSDLSQARRWGMELLQNCGDVAYENSPVNVRITLTEDKLLFEHNGKPFRVKDILSIINQVSSKNPNEKTVGRFGTGFMSTFQLSEIVEISSVLSDKTADGALPYRPFKVTLDHRGHSKEEILASIAHSMKELEYVDCAELETEFNPRAFNTRFTYFLNCDEGRICARTGVSDLKNTILYILLFSPTIASVEIIDKIGGEHTTFERGEITQIDDVLYQIDIGEKSDNSVKMHRIAFAKDGTITLAALFDENRNFLRHNELLSRIFTVFPLIGAEQFPFPVIINSPDFHPNEPRSNITLVDNAASVDAATNKELMQKAVRLYGDFLASAVKNGFSDIENIVEIPPFREDKEMSSAWVRENIYNALLDVIGNCEMIRVRTGEFKRLFDENLLVADAKTAEEKIAVKALCESLGGVLTPSGGERWNEAFAGYEIAEEKLITAEKLFLNTEQYLKRFTGSADELVDWCGRLFALSENSEELQALIKTDKAKIFPNQNAADLENKRLLSFGEVFLDCEIPEILKDVSEQLDQLKSSTRQTLEIRKSLLNERFKFPEKTGIPSYELTKLTSYIAERSNRGFTVINFNFYRAEYEKSWQKAWLLMCSCCEDESFYNGCKALLRDVLPEHTTIPERFYADRNLWYHSLCNVFKMASDVIQNLANTKALSEFLENDENSTVNQIVALVNSAISNGCSVVLKDACIYPNLNGDFVRLCENYFTTIYFDSVHHKQLYDIAEAFADIDLSNKIKLITVDQRFNINALGLPPMTDEFISQKINHALSVLFSQGTLSNAPDNQQEACTTLLALIQTDEPFAKQLFPSYSSEEDQMKLLTPRSAVKMQKTANMFKELCSALDLGDEENALELIKRELLLRNNHSFGYMDEFGVFTEREIGMTDDDFRKYCREIGKAGEKFVFETLTESFIEQGFSVTSRTETEVVLLDTSKQKRAVVSLGDSGNYTQRGWDIRVKITENQQETCEFYEVKTHTVSSAAANRILLSPSQMQFAMSHKNEYTVALVRCTRKTLECTGMRLFKNIPELIGSGEFVGEDNFSFYVKK